LFVVLFRGMRGEMTTLRRFFLIFAHTGTTRQMGMRRAALAVATYVVVQIVY